MRLVSVLLRDNGKGLLHILEATQTPILAYGAIGDDIPMKEEAAARILNNGVFAIHKKIIKPNNHRKDLSENVRPEPASKPKANRPGS